MSMFKMTAKGFGKVTKRDFDNGAVRDEIHNALVDREKLLADNTELQAELATAKEENKRLREAINIAIPMVRATGSANVQGRRMLEQALKEKPCTEQR